MRLIDAENNQLGVVQTLDALGKARDAGMDLVEVAPTERPPVCRIMDYGKFKYAQKKKGKDRPVHKTGLKELRLRPKTDDNDRLIKMNRARSFLQEGHKVQFTMLFRGRERFHGEVGQQQFKSIVQELQDAAKMERAPSMEGRRLTMVLAPLH